MALNFDRLTQEVTELKTVHESVVTLLREVAESIRTNAAVQSRVEAIADDLDRTTNALAAAVAENTAPVPLPDPLPVPEAVQAQQGNPFQAETFQQREDRYQAQAQPVQAPAASTGADSL